MTERSQVQTPYHEDFSFTIDLDPKSGAKRDNGMFKSTWHCCMCCNGRVDIEESWLTITKDRHEVCNLTKTKVQH